MPHLLITGATGNVGRELIRFLSEQRDPDLAIHAAVRKPEKVKAEFLAFPKLQYRPFDFEDTTSIASAFREIDILFLLRPPHISQVERYFTPLLQAAREAGIQKVVFLSVQRAEKSSIIPHHKIEKLILAFGFQYIFVRPGYFMQNLSTTLQSEIQQKHSITLPAGKAKFNWVDVQDIAEATARLIVKFDDYQNTAPEITGSEALNFYEVARLLRDITDFPIRYQNMNPIRFFFRKKREGLNSSFALVMTLLHFLPRIQPNPPLSEAYQQITGKQPTRLREFLEREKDLFMPQNANIPS